jgi:hypothetical protein
MGARTGSLDRGRLIGGLVGREREFIVSAVPDALPALHPDISARNLSHYQGPLAPSATGPEGCKISQQWYQPRPRRDFRWRSNTDQSTLKDL